MSDSSRKICSPSGRTNPTRQPVKAAIRMRSSAENLLLAILLFMLCFATPYCVLGNGPTQHYDDYDDALDEFNLRWMREKFGE